MECDDVLVPLGQEAKITARLTPKDLFRLGLTLKRRVISFRVDGQPLGKARAGWNGRATMSFTPLREKEYHVVATCGGRHGSRSIAAESIVFSRTTNKSAIILDVDRTLSAGSTFASVFRRNTKISPLDDAVDVTRALAQRYDLIVVTGRKAYFWRKTKRWLEQNGFPRAPIYFSSFLGRPFGHEQFKTQLIRELKCAWTNITIGVGDRDSDARAYLANGLRAILLRAKGPCPPGAILVSDWKGIRKLLLG